MICNNAISATHISIGTLSKKLDIVNEFQLNEDNGIRAAADRVVLRKICRRFNFLLSIPIALE
jgi:hypothetical protein